MCRGYMSDSGTFFSVELSWLHILLCEVTVMEMQILIVGYVVITAHPYQLRDRSQ